MHNKAVLPIVIFWNGAEWKIFETGEPGFRIGPLQFDSRFRIHAAGNQDQDFWSGDPACYAYYDSGKWNTLGSEGIYIPHTMETNPQTGYSNMYEMDLALDNKDYPHPSLGLYNHID